MKSGISILALFLCLFSSPAAEPIRIQFNSYSLIVRPADDVFFGFDYHNEITSDPGLPLTNGEVEIAGIEAYSHWGYFLMEDEMFGTLVYDFVLDIPGLDANSNDTPDILEFSRGVSGRTGGEYFGFRDGDFTCDWSKDPNSYIGTCTISFDFGPVFTHQFEIYEYAGTWSGAVMSENGEGTVNLNLARAGIEGEFLSGPLKFRVADQKLTLLASSDLKVLGAPFKWNENVESILSDGNIFVFPYLIDGTPSIDPEILNFEDFNEWQVIITDTGDADSDGIPDLLESAVTPPKEPTLEIIRTAEGLRVLIHGEVGRTYILEDTETVPSANWLHPMNITADVNPKGVDLPLPSGALFWRARVL